MQTVGESPMAGQMPPEMHKNILHSSLTTDSFLLLASDMMGPEGAIKGNTITLCLICSSEEEIHTFYSNLSSGGEIGHPLEEVFFGTFGDLTDKFGMNWMFQFDKNSQA